MYPLHCDTGQGVSQEYDSGLFVCDPKLDAVTVAVFLSDDASFRQGALPSETSKFNPGHDLTALCLSHQKQHNREMISH